MSESEPIQETVAVPREQLIEHAITLAQEEPSDHYDVWVPDQCEDWSIRDMDVETVDLDTDGTVHIHGTTTDTVSEQVRRATRLNPPEYRNHEVTIRITIELNLAGNLGFGEAYVHVEADEDPLAPPSPDVHAHMYDL